METCPTRTTCKFVCLTNPFWFGFQVIWSSSLSCVYALVGALDLNVRLFVHGANCVHYLYEYDEAAVELFPALDQPLLSMQVIVSAQKIQSMPRSALLLRSVPKIRSTHIQETLQRNRRHESKSWDDDMILRASRLQDSRASTLKTHSPTGAAQVKSFLLDWGRYQSRIPLTTFSP